MRNNYLLFIGFGQRTYNEFFSISARLHATVDIYFNFNLGPHSLLILQKSEQKWTTYQLFFKTYLCPDLKNPSGSDLFYAWLKFIFELGLKAIAHKILIHYGRKNSRLACLA